MNATSYVYVSLIEATPRQLWRALTDSQYIARYFDNTGPRSDWQVGSTVEWRIEDGGEYHDWGQRVLESIPERRLSYTWHNYEPEMVKFFPDWSGDKLERMRDEPVSRVTFDLDPVGPKQTKLTFTHDGFVEGSAMLAGVSEGWPEILSKLKTLMEESEPEP
ncbi:MAG: SRPBCC family protein [Stackebrandtia sp.]